MEAVDLLKSGLKRLAKMKVIGFQFGWGLPSVTDWIVYR
jgi:hypothetical protein